MNRIKIKLVSNFSRTENRFFRYSTLIRNTFFSIVECRM